MNRRTFLKAGAAAVGGFAASHLAFAAEAEILLSPGEPGAVINPHIYGHFIEHLGGVIYDGVWVGRDSSIPNVDGIRNQFGVHEFMHLCRLIGAEPYVAANVGSGTPSEFHDWVSYCNAPTGTLSLADDRAANGDPQPFGIRYWGVGNESWGCGGAMRPEEYASKYRQFVTQFPNYTEPFLVATGPRGH